MDHTKLNAAVEQYVKPITFPVAVKISDSKEIPAKFRQPNKLVGHRLNICQGVNLVRRFGWNIGFQEEDHACGLSILILGYKEVPEFAINGHTVCPAYVKTPEAGARTQADTLHAEVGSIGSILLSPLGKADFEPDVVLVYGNPAQIVRLIQGALYLEGGSIKSSFMGRCACAGEFVYPHFKQECNVIIPGGGERVFAMTNDDELVFAIPRSKFESVAVGVEATHKGGVARIPTPFFGIQAEPKFPAVYEELDKYTGLK
ncbi:MAG: DUF169 domain-containing protein [Firmicutes bacterium]|nr:DUF169 domain-containing protein [Bacillota bacterium]